MSFETANWTTEHSHPASRMVFQVADITYWAGDPKFVPGTFARVLVEGREVVPPNRNISQVMSQYNGRFNRWCKDAGLEEFIND